MHRFGQPVARHAGRGLIGEQQVHRRRLLLNECQRGLRLREHVYHVSIVPQRALHHASHPRLVVHDHHTRARVRTLNEHVVRIVVHGAPVLGGRQRDVGQGFRNHRVVVEFLIPQSFDHRARKAQLEGGALSDLAGHVGTTQVRDHDTVQHGHAKARAFAGGLGGEEGFEHPVAYVDRHAVARVTDLQHHHRAVRFRRRIRHVT